MSDSIKLPRTQRIISDSGVTSMGGYLICAPGCGERRSLTAAQIGRYMQHGWPKHCGHTMQWITAKQAARLHGGVDV